MAKKKNPFLRKTFLIYASIFLPLLFSCSIKYENEVSASESNPELTFTNATFYRYENNQLKIQLTSSLIEQYKSDLSFAQDAVFSSWDKDGQLDTSGSCKILSMDTRKEVYTFLNDIQIESQSNAITLTADALRWNGKTEQLTSNRDTPVFISKDDMTISGLGFSASAVSKSYSFASQISGEIFTNDGSESEPQNENMTSEDFMQ